MQNKKNLKQCSYMESIARNFLNAALCLVRFLFEYFYGMSLRNIAAFCMMIIVATNACARPAAKKAKTHFKLLEATSWRTIPGIPDAPVKTQYRFVIVWQGAKYPETFFWRGTGGWLPCSIAKAHRMKKGGYTTEEAAGDNIHKGDTLELIPMTGGKFPIPAEIPAKAKNTLFYKTGSSGWLSFYVKNITKKPDVVHP